MTQIRNERVKLINGLIVSIRKKVAESFLRVATYTRQLIQQAIKNNLIRNLK